MPIIPEDAFSTVFVSQTFSQIKDGITYDFHVQANKKLLKNHPELLPTRLMAMYPKHPEMQYLECIRDIIQSGNKKDDRTGTGVLSKFGY